MPKLRRVGIPALLLVLVAGCAAPVHYEYNSAPYANWHTFAWKAPKAETVRNPILDSGILGTRVRDAVRRVLAADGYAQASDPSQADFLVTYHTALQKTRQGGPSVGFAYGTWGPGFNTIFMSSPGNRETQEGSLILDIIDARQNQLVWRGWVTNALSQSNYSQQAVDGAVRKILSKFPPPAKH